MLMLGCQMLSEYLCSAIWTFPLSRRDATDISPQPQGRNRGLSGVVGVAFSQSRPASAANQLLYIAQKPNQNAALQIIFRCRH